jgi:hypothetical protein
MGLTMEDLRIGISWAFGIYAFFLILFCFFIKDIELKNRLWPWTIWLNYFFADLWIYSLDICPIPLFVFGVIPVSIGCGIFHMKYDNYI